jgi:hypothetical protein
MIDARAILGDHDVLFVTLDTLRYDVAQAAFQRDEIPTLKRMLPASGWEKRHSPASFTYAAHQAFFAGFLPTPASPGSHPRLLAAGFKGSTTTTDQTLVFEASDIVSGFAAAGYHTLCIGGVGFFNKLNPLGSVLPGLFAESHWCPEFGVTDPESTKNQVDFVLRRCRALPKTQRLFLFLNVSALHQPNCYYLPGCKQDNMESHAAALRYVDSELPRLFATLQERAPVLCVVCSDHGTAYGEDGYRGHRVSHPTVWDVPYAEFVLPESRS